MNDFNLDIKKRVVKATGDPNISFVIVPEAEEIVRERNFQVRLKSEVREKLDFEIRKTIEKLQSQTEAEKKASFDQGYEEGVQAGLGQAYAGIERMKEHFWNLVREANDLKETILKEAESTVVKLAYAFTANIVGEVIKTNEKIVINQVKKALEYVIGKSHLQIRVNPDDLSVFENKEEFIPEEYLEHIEIIPDEMITRGGCVLTTDSGIIDSTIETQFAEMENAINNGMESPLESDPE